MADLRCYLTFAGIAAENNAKQFGTSLKITEMVFDGSYLADEQNPENLTAVINPVLTVPCSSSLSADKQTLTFKGSILVEQGGFNVWGIGLKTNTGVLYGYARSKGDKILTENEGATESVRYAVDIVTKNADVIEIKINQSTVYADLEDVDNAVAASIKKHEDATDPHPKYMQTKSLLRALVFTPVHNIGVGYTPNENYVAPSIGQRCYVSEYPTCWELIQTFSNVIDEAAKAASIIGGSKTYAGYWGIGTDATGDYFTTPNAPEFMHYKSAGIYGNEGEFKADHVENITASFSAKTTANESAFFQMDSSDIDVTGAFFTGNSYLALRDTQYADGGSNPGFRDFKFDASRVARTSEFTDTMGVFANSFIWLPKGVF